MNCPFCKSDSVYLKQEDLLDQLLCHTCNVFMSFYSSDLNNWSMHIYLDSTDSGKYAFITNCFKPEISLYAPHKLITKIDYFDVLSYPLQDLKNKFSLYYIFN